MAGCSPTWCRGGGRSTLKKTHQTVVETPQNFSWYFFGVSPAPPQRHVGLYPAIYYLRTLHKDVSAFTVIFCWILLRMRHIWKNIVKETQTQFYVLKPFSQIIPLMR
jgi:hypothetical protein